MAGRGTELAPRRSEIEGEVEGDRFVIQRKPTTGVPSPVQGVGTFQPGSEGTAIHLELVTVGWIPAVIVLCLGTELLGAMAVLFLIFSRQETGGGLVISLFFIAFVVAASLVAPIYLKADVENHRAYLIRFLERMIEARLSVGS